MKPWILNGYVLIRNGYKKGFVLKTTFKKIKLNIKIDISIILIK